MWKIDGLAIPSHFYPFQCKEPYSSSVGQLKAQAAEHTHTYKHTSRYNTQDKIVQKKNALTTLT